ncbi:MAG: hypothetical protein JEZ08_11900 [Clostridiales bacterium]|nr:hypothetical protein [Clostridiales bacterium]
MRRFTHDTFRSILKDINKENNVDFESFIEVMDNRFDILFDSEIDEIIGFLSEEMGVESDADICNMSVGEVKQLINFTNQIVENLYDEK